MISEDSIKKHLDWALHQADPGDDLHHLFLFTAPPDALTAFGTVDEDKVKGMMFVIAAMTGSGETSMSPEQLIQATIKRLRDQFRKSSEQVIFAVLSQELWRLDRAGDDPLADELLAQGRLQEHPDVTEATMIYAVCRDGRRWRGQRFLTGPRAGEELIDPLIGRITRGESGPLAGERDLLALVGLTPAPTLRGRIF